MITGLTIRSGRNFGLRRQSAAATAFSPARKSLEFTNAPGRSKSGVALRFPPQSKTRLVDEQFFGPELCCRQPIPMT